jgi:hypothetical protein
MIKDPEFQKLLEEELEKRFHLCPKCGRPIPPEGLDSDKVFKWLLDKAFKWLLDNDTMVRQAYDLGRHEERAKARISNE